MNRPLREIAKEKGWSLREVAEKADSPYTTVANFLKGTTKAGPELLRKLGFVFKIDPDEIENPQPSDVEALRESRLPYRTEAERLADAERRALRAESQLAEIRLGLRELLDRSERSVETQISSAKVSGAAKLAMRAGGQDVSDEAK